MRRLSAILGCLAALLVFPGGAGADLISGSPHDLSSLPGFPATTLGGVCGECHTPHRAREIRIWPRDANRDSIRFNVRDVTALCFDCHATGPAGVPWAHSAPVWAHTPHSAFRLSGSAHDMGMPPTPSTKVAPRGACTGCHNLHQTNPANPAITGSGSGKYITNDFQWSRALTNEVNGIYQKRHLGAKSTDGSIPPNGGPNYLVGKTLLCYDCHSGNDLDSVPNTNSDFLSPRLSPQNIAFAAGSVGYYELPSGQSPSSGNTAPSLLYVLSKDRTRRPGGHYVKSLMSMHNGTANARSDNYGVRLPGGILSYRISVADKLPCDLCHDAHKGEVSSGTSMNDEAFFRRAIPAGYSTLVMQPASYSAFNNCFTKSPKSRGGTGNGRLMCFYCHGSSDWNRSYISPNIPQAIPPLRIPGYSSPPVGVYGIMINQTNNPNPALSSRAFPPPGNVSYHAYSNGSVTKPCTDCHSHNDPGGGDCASCHGFPPHTGAHDKHAAVPPYGPAIQCDDCHGVGAGTNRWHLNKPGGGAYNSTNDFAYITLKPSLWDTDAAKGSAWYNTTWSRSGASLAATVQRAAGYSFNCTNVYCHGMQRVNWNWHAQWNTNSQTSATPPAGYLTCGGCHGMFGWGPSNPRGNIYTAAFRGHSGTLYRASNTAVNYMRPLSRFSHGGHGDTTIRTQSPVIKSAVAATIPVACGFCHDGSKAHLPPANNNPYRLKDAALNNTLGDADPVERRITNLCTQTNCHAKYTGDGSWPTLQRSDPSHLHGSDEYFRSATATTQHRYYIGSLSAGQEIILTAPPTSNTSPRYNPVGISPTVGVDIDRYVDHWQWWGTYATSDNTDSQPFLPLGDMKASANSSYTNVANSSAPLTCITCHNPHGTDLFVINSTPGQPNSWVEIPNNRMLRLRNEDGELCRACH